MVKKGRIIMIGLLTFIMIVATVRGDSAFTEEGFVLQSECLSDTILHEYINLNISGSQIYMDGGNITCPNGCRENWGKYGADCLNYGEISRFDTTLLIIWICIYIFLGWIYKTGWKELAMIFILINSLAGLLVAQHPIMLIPISISIIMLLWVFGVIKSKRAHMQMS